MFVLQEAMKKKLEIQKQKQELLNKQIQEQKVSGDTQCTIIGMQHLEKADLFTDYQNETQQIWSFVLYFLIGYPLPTIPYCTSHAHHSLLLNTHPLLLTPYSATFL